MAKADTKEQEDFAQKLETARKEHCKDAVSALMKARESVFHVKILNLMETFNEKGLGSNSKEMLEYMEILAGLQEKWVEETRKQIFFAALADFQYLCPTILKEDSAGKYHYANLAQIAETIHPVLNACGLSYRFSVSISTLNSNLAQPPMAVEAKCMLSHITGHTEENKMEVPVEYTQWMNKAQSHGSAQTYAQRYALMSALGLTPHDMKDDDGAASGPGAAGKDKPRRGKKNYGPGPSKTPPNRDVPPRTAHNNSDKLTLETFDALIKEIAEAIGIEPVDLTFALRERVAQKQEREVKDVDITELYEGRTRGDLYSRIDALARDLKPKETGNDDE